MLLLPNQNNISPRFWYLNDSIPRDTSLLIVYYSLKFIPDTTSKKQHETVTVNEFGNNWTTYYSLAHRFQNIVQTKVHNQMSKMPIGSGIGVNYKYSEQELETKRMAGEVGYMDFEIWIDKLHGELYERRPDYQRENLAYEYCEPFSNMKWVTINQRDSTICGYKCIAASCTFRGRKWLAWFTPHIPINTGPWKFNGLPGLILKIYDQTGSYSWDCIGIKKAQIPMMYYELQTIVLPKKKYIKWLSNIHKSPYISIAGVGANTLIMTADNKILDDSWVLPYNPIELE